MRGHAHVHEHDVDGPVPCARGSARAPPARRRRPRATTSRSGWESMTIRNPARTSCWSSTRATRIGVGHRAASSGGHGGGPRVVAVRSLAASAGVGSSARTRKPPPGRGPAVTVPPNIAARSRMPSRPCPSAVGVGRGAAAVVGDLEHERVGQPLHAAR